MRIESKKSCIIGIHGRKEGKYLPVLSIMAAVLLCFGRNNKSLLILMTLKLQKTRKVLLLMELGR